MAQAATQENVERVVFDALESIGAKRDSIALDTRLDTLQVDSLDVVELLQVIEEEFAIEIRGDEAKDLTTVGSVVDLIVVHAQAVAH
jgi:acyl carrier protein